MSRTHKTAIFTAVESDPGIDGGAPAIHGYGRAGSFTIGFLDYDNHIGADRWDANGDSIQEASREVETWDCENVQRAVAEVAKEFHAIEPLDDLAECVNALGIWRGWWRDDISVTNQVVPVLAATGTGPEFARTGREIAQAIGVSARSLQGILDEMAEYGDISVKANGKFYVTQGQVQLDSYRKAL